MYGNPKDALPLKPGGSPGGKGQVVPPKPATVDVVTVASVMGDDAQAQTMVTTSVVAQFNVDHGAEMGALNGEISVLDAKKEFLSTEEKTIKQDLEAEKPNIACAPDGAVTYWAWTARDKIEAPLLGVCIATSIVAAVSVAHGNMVASGVNESGQVDIPAVLNTVMETRPGGDEAAVILFADPRSVTALAPSVSMGGGALPNDGHLAATLSRSPYGTSGLRGSLQGCEVCFGITAPDWAISQAHAQGGARFWQASVEARGGSFQMMSDDIATVLARSGAPGVAADPVPLVVTTKLEMIQFQPDTGQVLDIYGVQPSPEPAPAPLWAAARDVSVGLSWDCTTCDLDLYLRPNPAAEVIFFGQAQSAQGQLFKDHLASPSLTNGYETIALNGVVDLSQMQIAVNHYGGHATGPVTGELRIAIGAQVWARTLTLPAGAGNGGDGAEAALVERVVPNAAWVLVDPMAVLDGS